jgi:pimeloyl-ACP methyl ester carboxylesterase
VTVSDGPVEYRHEPHASSGPASSGVASAAPPLVFLHEGLGSVALWRGFVDEVRAATGGPETWVFSRHGHGRSGPARLPRPAAYMHHEALDVLPELRASLGIDRPVLVGHSDGASIALIHAGAGHPVAGVVAIAPHVVVEDVSLAAIAEVRRRYETTGMAERMGRHHDDPDATFYGWNDVWLSPEFRAWDITDHVAAVDCPVLVVQGEDDEYGTLAQVDAIEARVRGPFRRVVLPGAGHAPHFDAPDVVVAAVAGFVASL